MCFNTCPLTLLLRHSESMKLRIDDKTVISVARGKEDYTVKMGQVELKVKRTGRNLFESLADEIFGSLVIDKEITQFNGDRYAILVILEAKLAERKKIPVTVSKNYD